MPAEVTHPPSPTKRDVSPISSPSATRPRSRSLGCSGQSQSPRNNSPSLSARSVTKAHRAPLRDVPPNVKPVHAKRPIQRPLSPSSSTRPGVAPCGAVPVPSLEADTRRPSPQLRRCTVPSASTGPREPEVKGTGGLRQQLNALQRENKLLQIRMANAEHHHKAALAEKQALLSTRERDIEVLQTEVVALRNAKTTAFRDKIVAERALHDERTSNLKALAEKQTVEERLTQQLRDVTRGWEEKVDRQKAVLRASEEERDLAVQALDEALAKIAQLEAYSRASSPARVETKSVGTMVDEPSDTLQENRQLHDTIARLSAEKEAGERRLASLRQALDRLRDDKLGPLQHAIQQLREQRLRQDTHSRTADSALSVSLTLDIDESNIDLASHSSADLDGTLPAQPFEEF